MSTFCINRITLNKPEEKAIQDYVIHNELNSSKGKPKNKNRLYVTASARSKLFKEIKWGNLFVKDYSEQGGLLIGKSYLDNNNGFYYAEVNSIISAMVENHKTSYKYNYECWKSMLDTLYNYNKNIPTLFKENIVGWYHTHKGEKEVYMSKKDMSTHKLFSKDYQFGIVLNPQKQIWKAYSGNPFKEANGYMLK